VNRNWALTEWTECKNWNSVETRMLLLLSRPSTVVMLTTPAASWPCVGFAVTPTPTPMQFVQGIDPLVHRSVEPATASVNRSINRSAHSAAPSDRPLTTSLVWANGQNPPYIIPLPGENLPFYALTAWMTESSGWLYMLERDRVQCLHWGGEFCPTSF